MITGIPLGAIVPSPGVPVGALPFKAVATIGVTTGTVATPVAPKTLFVTDLIITNQATVAATITISDGGTVAPFIDAVPFIVAATTTTKVSFTSARQYQFAVLAITTSVAAGSAVVTVNGGTF